MMDDIEREGVRSYLPRAGLDGFEDGDRERRRQWRRKHGRDGDDKEMATIPPHSRDQDDLDAASSKSMLLEPTNIV